jgi:uncharacterized protein
MVNGSAAFQATAALVFIGDLPVYQTTARQGVKANAKTAPTDLRTITQMSKSLPMSPDPLSEAELDKLDDFLMEKSGLENAMDIAMLDGYLTAVVVGPRTLLPNQWLPFVWDMERGEAMPKFKNPAEAQRVFMWLIRHMNSIARTLSKTPEDYEPLLMENPNHGDPIPIIDEWCLGFMTGVALDQEHWQPLVEKDPKLFEVLKLYGTEAGLKELMRAKHSLEKHREFAETLGDTVRVIHAYWLKQRMMIAAH